MALLPSLALFLLFFSLSSSQPPPDYFDEGGGPPPWHRHHHGGGPPPPWLRGGPRGGPPPPWWRGGPRGGPWRDRGPPPWGVPPPMPPPLPPPLPPPIPPPPTPPTPIMARPRWIPRVQTLIKSIDQFNAVFQKPGQGYDDVLKILNSFYNRHTSNASYDANSIELPSGVTGSELGPNKHVAGALFEVDMVLTVPQANGVAAAGGRRRRMLYSRAAALWPTTIPYSFHENDSEWRARILQAIWHIEKNTCLRFQEQQNPSGDYIIFTRGEGCMSALGRLGGAQQVSIGYGCEQLGIVVHELGHTLGFWHEHSRPDRDIYLKVNRQNMLNGVEGQFVKRSTAEADTLSLPFDYASVMHYAANSYSRSSTLYTLEPTDVLYRSTIGSRSEPSFLDYKHINTLYCRRTCNALPCQNGGYVDPKNCSACKCPIGLGGTYCEQVQQSVCGMELTASSFWRNISFSGSSNCYWRVRSSQRNLRIDFELTHVWFACAPSCDEYVEMKWQGDLSLAGGRLCCHPEGGIRTTAADTLVVIAKTTRSSQFTLRYRLQGGAQPRPRQVPLAENIDSRPHSTNVADRKESETTTPWSPPGERQGEWTEWSEWGVCGERCGACGRRNRTRACQRGECSGEGEENEVCNYDACQPGTTLSGRRVKRDAWCCQDYKLTDYGICRPI